jgi:type IV pilus assembly protein PilE
MHSAAPTLQTRMCGFTLVELMIVVVIVGILAAVAYPSFTEQVRKSRRVDCAGTLLQNANAMERHFTLNNTYLGAPALLQCPADGGKVTYTVTAAPVTTAASFTLRAEPIGAQAGDRCGTLTLTHTGIKGVDGANAGLTWQNCW